MRLSPKPPETSQDTVQSGLDGPLPGGTHRSDCRGQVRSLGEPIFPIFPMVKSDKTRAICFVYPLVMTNSLLLNISIEIVDFPMKHGESFHSYVINYQRLSFLGFCTPFPPLSFGGSKSQKNEQRRQQLPALVFSSPGWWPWFWGHVQRGSVVVVVVVVVANGNFRRDDKINNGYCY